MKVAHYDRYFRDRFILQGDQRDVSNPDEICSGELIDREGARPPAPIVNGIPRFVPADNYAANFGLQWNTFKANQLDSHNGLRLTFNRFWSSTRWKPKDLYGKTVLEVGSGAGRFTEILLDAGCHVVSVDYSSAVEANFENNNGRGDLCLLQADIYDLPLASGSFEYVFCHGVLQHTPDPDRAWKALFNFAAPGGHISIDYYLKFRWPNVWSTPKYIWRPITTKMDPAQLLKIIQTYIPIWFPIDSVIRRVPKIGPAILAFVPVPCWNPVGSGLSWSQRRDWAIMDTFDALAPAYDEPRTLEEVRRMVASEENASTDVFYGGNGVVANVTKTKTKTKSVSG